MHPLSVSVQRRSGLATSWIARHWLRAALLAAALIVVVGAASLSLYVGIYNVAADAPHTQPVYWFLKTLRERSIAARTTDIIVPSNLDGPKRIAAGAGQYAEMCSGCHLAPGMKRTEMSRGLYPRAPELRRKSDLTPAEQFWIVKHGVKMTGMPTWGVTHDDELIWNVVAFLQKLPELTADQYQALVKSAPKSHDEMMRDMEMGNGHGHDDQPQQ